MPRNKTLTSQPALYEAQAKRWWTYADLAEGIRTAALPATAKSLIFIFCRNDMRSVLAYLAAFESGHTAALLDDNLAPEAKARLIETYRPDFVSTAAPLPTGHYTPLTETLWRSDHPSAQPLHPDLALLLSTSGSTGSPRFVRLTARNVESNAESISEALSIGSGDCAITSLPIHYSYGLSVLNTHLLRGASVALTDSGLLEPGFWQAFREASCTSLAGVPYTYQILSRLGPDRLKIPTLNTMTQAGGRMSPELIDKFSSWIKTRGGRFFVMYGQTEATARISVLPSAALPEKLGSVGVPIPGGHAEIRDGELVYSGPNVMLGYASTREDLTLGDVNQGVLRTGDLAHTDPDGFLFITGRAARDAKLFGLRINLDEVENMLREHGPVAAVYHNEQVRIFVEQGDDETLQALRRDLAARLRIHHDGFAFERLEKLPVTASGKTDYPTLAARP